MRNLTRYGTYGFLSLLLAAQMASAPNLFASEKNTKERVGAKKNIRTHVKKAQK